MTKEKRIKTRLVLLFFAFSLGIEDCNTARKNLTAMVLSHSFLKCFSPSLKESVRFSTASLSARSKSRARPPFSFSPWLEKNTQESSLVGIGFAIPFKYKTFRLGSPVFFIRKSFHHFVPPQRKIARGGAEEKDYSKFIMELLSLINVYVSILKSFATHSGKAYLSPYRASVCRCTLLLLSMLRPTLSLAAVR